MKRLLFALLAFASLGFAQQTTDPATGNPGTGTPGTGTPGTGTNTVRPAEAVLVYELEFKHVAGFNVSFWRGGYVVVPAIGGTGDAIFTSFDRRKEYHLQTGKVAFYPANTDDQRYSIVAMAGGSVGAAEPLLAMQAFGKVDQTISAKTENYEIKARAAKVLHGMALASRDEAKLAEAARPKDGTQSYIQFSEMNLRLDEDFTNRLNKRGGVLSEATKAVEDKVKAAGFVNAVGTTPGGGTGGGGTGGGGTGGGGTGGGGTGGGGIGGTPTVPGGDPVVR
jgi:hypothetical protein